MKRLILGNSASFVAAGFLILSSTSKKLDKIYVFQLAECIFMIIAQLFFGQMSAAIVLFISIFRNLMLINNKYGKKSLVLINVLVVLSAFFLYDGNLISLLPAVSAVIYNFCSYKREHILLLKYGFNFIFALWLVYSLYVLDVFSLVVNSVSLLLNIKSIIKIKKEGSRNKA